MLCQARLPRVLDLNFVRHGPGGLGWEVPDPACVVEVSAEGPIQHAEPVALVALAAWADHVRQRGSTILVADSVKSRYAWNTGILTALAGKTPFCEHLLPADEWFPLCRAASEPIIDALGGNVSLLLNVPTSDAREALAFTIGEMVRNAHEHRRTDCPIFFAAGWFRSQGRLTFAVADAGIGIPAHLRAARRVTAEDDDAAALERALQPLVTGESADDLGAPSNAGMGLFLTRGIVAGCSGELLVQSSGVRFLEQRGARGSFEPCTPWKGTLVQVTLRVHQMPSFSALYQSLVVAGGAELGSDLRFTSGPKEATDLEPPIDNAGFAANKGWFEEHRAAFHEELAEGGMVTINFRTAHYTTQSAVHALLYVPLRKLGPRALKSLWFSNASPQVRAVIRQVVRYALDHHRAEQERRPAPPEE